MKTMTRDQSRDTGSAIVLLLLLMTVATRRDGFAVAAVIAQVLVMAWPDLFRPLAVVWFGLSHVLGRISSAVLMSLVFLLVVTPVGLVRRLSGKDPLKRRAFRNGRESVMIVRNHTFSRNDLDHPY